MISYCCLVCVGATFFSRQLDDLAKRNDLVMKLHGGPDPVALENALDAQAETMKMILMRARGMSHRFLLESALCKNNMESTLIYARRVAGDLAFSKDKDIRRKTRRLKKFIKIYLDESEKSLSKARKAMVSGVAQIQE